MPLVNDRDKQFFAPLWRRIVLIVFCFGWAAFEFWGGDQNWGYVAAGIGFVAVWIFLIRWEADSSEGGKK